MDPVVKAVLGVAAAGAVAGLIGGLFASRRAGVAGSIFMGVLGGIAGAAIARVANVEPLMPAGAGFSYVYAALGGLVLGFATSASNK